MIEGSNIDGNLLLVAFREEIGKFFRLFCAIGLFCLGNLFTVFDIERDQAVFRAFDRLIGEIELGPLLLR